MEQPWLCIQIDGEYYLHEVSRVREIIPYETPNTVPGSSADNLGIITLRGEVVTVFSGRRLLSLNGRAPNAESLIVTFDTDNALIGVVVDEVAEIISLDTGAIEYNEAGGITRGAAQLDDRLYIIIDFIDALRQG